MATKREGAVKSEPHTQFFEEGSKGMKQSYLEDETRLWRLISSLFSQLRKDCPIFGVLVIGETGSGKSTLINNLLGREVAPVGHTLESETQVVTPHELSVERVPVVVYDTPGLDDTREDEDEEEKQLAIMKSILARGKIHLVIYCLKMTETRMRRGLVRTFKEYHKIGVPWEQTVVTLTFADNVNDTDHEHRFSQMQQQLRKILTERAGVLPSTVEKLKICPTAKDPNEALPTGRPWFVPFWLDVVEVLVPAALVRFLNIHKGNIHMETAPVSSEPKLVNVTLAGEEMERFTRKMMTLSEPQEAETNGEPFEAVSLDEEEEEGSAKIESGQEKEKDLSIGEAEEKMVNQVSPSSHLYSPVYFTGSRRSDSSHLYQMMIRNTTESRNSGSLYVASPNPVLLSSQLFSLKWEPISTAATKNQDGHRSATPLFKYMLQNLDCRKLEEANISLNPSLEFLYLKPNTICVYTINLEQLSTTAHEVFSEMCDFLSLFQSLRKPAGMQVILAAVYDSTTEYGEKLRKKQRAWLIQNISLALKSKFNEILHKDDQDHIEIVPVNLAECEGSAKLMQAAIGECINRYYQRMKGIDADAEKIPLQLWPLFRQEVLELAYRCHVVVWEELAYLARQVLWIEEGELFEHCLTALEQSTSLWFCHGPGTKSGGFLVNPDIVVRIISRLADRGTFKKIKTTIGKGVAELLCFHSSATQSVLQVMVNDTHINLPVSRLIQWMQTMGILFAGSGAATRDPFYFIPSITSSAQWEEAHGHPLPDLYYYCAELFIELRVPGGDTPPMPTLFFYQFVAHIISLQGIDATNLSVSQGCTRVKISSLKLTDNLMPCEALLSYDRLQCIIRVQLQPWQGTIIPTAHTYFRNVLKECEAKYGWSGMARAIMGPAFRAASSNAHCATLFAFLDEALAQGDPNSQPATFVVDADSLKEMSVRGIEPQLHIRDQDGSVCSHKVSEVVGLNQWIYDPTLLYENREADVNRMKAMNKVAEQLLQDPSLCVIIACENGIIGAQDPEAHNWLSNSGQVPAAYKLIQQWHGRKLPISQLREALQKHHHNAAANILLPFCDGMPQTKLHVNGINSTACV